MSKLVSFMAIGLGAFSVFYRLVWVAVFSCSILLVNAQPSGGLPPRMLAYDYLQQNRTDEAKLAFLKAIRLTPNDLLNYRDLALLYMMEKDYAKAESTVRTGLRIKATNADLTSVLAEILLQKGDKAGATRELTRLIGLAPKNVYGYSRLADVNTGTIVQRTWLLKAIAAAPANIVTRLRICELLANDRKADSALYYLQSVKKIEPDLSAAAAALYKKAAAALQGNQMSVAPGLIHAFHNQMQTSGSYAQALQEVGGPTLPVGHVEFTTSQVVNKYANTRKVTLQNMKFADATGNLGLDATNGAGAAVVAVTDYNSAGEMYLYSGKGTQSHLFTVTIGSLQETRVTGGIAHEGDDLDAAFADYDNDGFIDLFVATSKGIFIYKNQGDGTFARVKTNVGLAGSTNGRKMLFADFDQDGDLDLYLAQNGQNRFYRNNGNGTFTEQAAVMGLSATPGGAKDMDFADFDADGDVDIIASNETGSLKLFTNDRHAKFHDVAGTAQIGSPGSAGGVITVGDYNNDGFPDIFVGAKQNGSCSLLRNIDGKRFTEDAASKTISAALNWVNVQDAVFLDFDNDGHLDLLVAGIPKNSSVRGVQLFHNDTTKGFSNVTNLLPASVSQGYNIRLADFNSDGDDDIFIAGPQGIKLIRNDGGSLNHYLQVQLTGFSYGNSKNNRLGIGAQVEIKAGDLYQLKTLKSPLVTFGVGMRNTIDAVRIIWPNGMPQIIDDPSGNEKIVEKELLKGSCPFLFTWNGEKYEFVKDMMWRSALGMPVAIHNDDTAYAYSEPSTEYLMIPGEKLKEKDGLYSIKITEELWEAVYFDKLALVAVDHPASTNVYVDERFVAPPYPGKKVYIATHKYVPASATDDNGNDLLYKIKDYDFQYAASFSPGKYQGITEDHDLILDLGDSARNDSVRLFLRGWVFPTDASINTAVTQSDAIVPHAPSLQVINEKGEWETVIPNLGFPMGRDKVVVVDLNGKFLTAKDRRVRILTNMQIYWDEIFFTAGNQDAPVQMNDLTLRSADLGYRGYSATYRKGGPFGPEWLDYYSTTKGQKWRDLTGYYTRYGDVMPLLTAGDDKYIIANSGDEIAVHFDAKQLPALPVGWKRDFLIYSEGWVKDGDLNTANGQTVEPLPYHAMPAYPYNANAAYPADKEHTEYQRTYNTRKVTTGDFVNMLKPKK